MVMLGLTGATLAGVPIASALGQHFGWRAAFVFVGAIAALAVVLLRRACRTFRPHRAPAPARTAGAAQQARVADAGHRRHRLRRHVRVFSYIKPTLTEVAGLPLAQVPLVLALFGCRHGGRQPGRLAPGRPLADAHHRRLLLWSMLVLGGFVFAAHHVATAAVGTFLLGTIVAIGPACRSA
jgi:DHA1 family inner membrane transport protein